MKNLNKCAYLQCPTGIAGDMFLGALLDAGLPFDYLKNQLDKLGLNHEYHLSVTKVHHHGQVGTKLHVKLLSDHHHEVHFETHSHSHSHSHSLSYSHSHSHSQEHFNDHTHTSRHLPEIKTLILNTDLPERVKQWSLAIFQNLALAEAKVHGIAPEQVHFHEVGATDAIIDIVGTCIGLDWFNITQLFCSPLPTGGGTVKAEHGILAVPAPAVLNLFAMGNVPVYSNGINEELVTPTGASILITLVESFGDCPPLNLSTIGWGAGTKSFPIPNLVRLWIGENKIEDTNFNTSPDSLFHQESIIRLETQIDDGSPEVISYTLEKLLEAGALDVFTQPITMKKSRLGTLLTVICPVNKAVTCEQIIFQETSTLGIRKSEEIRSTLEREIVLIETPYGQVRVKLAYQGSGENRLLMNMKPEYQDCAEIARKVNQPLQAIQDQIMMAWVKKYC